MVCGAAAADAEERKPLLRPGQAVDDADNRGGCSAVCKSLISTCVALGNAVAGLLLTAILFLCALRLADVNKLSLCLGLRAELDPRGDNEMRFQELVTWAKANGATGLDRVSIDFFDPGGFQVKSLAAARSVDTDIGGSSRRRSAMRGGEANAISVASEVALKDASDDVITIPPGVILSEAHRMFQASPFANVQRPDESENTVMLYLASEKRRVQVGGKQSSFWAPLIRLLPSPQEYLGSHPLYASPELLVSYSLLPSTYLILQQQLLIQRAWEKNHEEWEAAAYKSGADGLEFEDFKWAFTAWKAHGSQLYDTYFGRNISAMVPVVNLLSPTGSSHRANAAWDSFGDPPTVRLELLPGVRQGDELFEATNHAGRPNDVVFLWTGELLKDNLVEVRQLGSVECDLLALKVANATEGQQQQQQLAQTFQALAREHCRKSWAEHGTPQPL